MSLFPLPVFLKVFRFLIGGRRVSGEVSTLCLCLLTSVWIIPSLSAATPLNSPGQVAGRQVLLDYPQERVYLHLDKPGYRLGDVIFYKIYATMGYGITPDTLSRTLYVELLDASGVVLQSQKKLLDRGLGSGSVDIPAHYEPGAYRLRAYTSWMRNFRTEPLFEQVIMIHDAQRKAQDWFITSSVKEGPELDTLHLSLRLISSRYQGGPAPYEFTFSAKDIEPFTTSATLSENGTNERELLLPKNRPPGLGQLSLTYADSTQAVPVVLSGNAIHVQFFPEGGQWIAGVSNRMAFKITDDNGTGLSGRGVIKNAQGAVVARFDTRHQGMGVFRMVPEKYELYEAELFVESKPARDAALPTQARILIDSLPEVQPQGYVMEVNSLDEDSIRICVRRGGLQQDETLGVVAQNGGQVVWQVRLRMRRDSAILIVPQKLFPTGVSQITLCRPDGAPVSERLVFVNNHDALNVQITSPKQSINPRAKTSLDVKVTDSKGNPVEGSFSMSVTDRSRVQDTARFGDNILTNLLLTSEVRGRIENPGYYFGNDTPQKREALEYLLLTQGWRRYLWNMGSPDTLPKLKYPVERGLRISGTILEFKTRKPVDNDEVTLLVVPKDDATMYADDVNGRPQLLLDYFAEGRMAATDTTDGKGRFQFVADYYGDVKVRILTAAKGASIERAINLDENVLSLREPGDGSSLFWDTYAGWGASSASILQTQATLKKFQQEQEKALPAMKLETGISRIIELNEVEVTAKKSIVRTILKSLQWKPSEELSKMAEATFMVQETLESLRNTKQITTVNQFLRAVYPQIFSRGRRIRYLIDGVVPQMMSEIFCYSKVEIVDSYETSYAFAPVEPLTPIPKPSAAPPTYIKSSIYGGSNSEILINLIPYPDGLCRFPTPGLREFTMQGYSKGKEFYAPDYGKDNTLNGPDVRTTLFWAPEIKTDSMGRATVSFFNSDQTTGLSVNVQGMGINGTSGVGAGRAEIGGK